MRFVRSAAALFALLAFACAACAGEKELFEIRVPFEKGAEVTVVRNGEARTVGTVFKTPTATRHPSYTASAWGTPGTVCASAVNAVHMLVSVEGGKGRTMSLIPKETIAPAAGAGASFVINAKAGESIFGAWAPAVGSEVAVEAPDGTRRPLAADNLPGEGDTLVIRACEYDDLPYMVDIENCKGGRVVGWYEHGYKILGEVALPVGGTGRFEGTLFQRTGAIRANHCGVIDVSTCPRGKTGGFQIIPLEHARDSKEMQHVWNMTQWMVIAPLDGTSKLGATAPLFKRGLVPGPSDGEELWDVWSTYGRKSLVLARYNNGDWERLHEASGKNGEALRDITALRIYYPFTEEIQKSH